MPPQLHPSHYRQMGGNGIIISSNSLTCGPEQTLRGRVLSICSCFLFSAFLGILLYAIIWSPHKNQGHWSALKRNTTTSTVNITDETLPEVSELNTTQATTASEIINLTHGEHSDDTIAHAHYPVHLVTQELPTPPTKVPQKMSLPLDPYEVSAVDLLHNVLLDEPKYYDIHCDQWMPTLHKEVVEIAGTNYTGETSIRKAIAKTYAAQKAATVLFGLIYPEPARPPRVCRSTDVI